MNISPNNPLNTKLILLKPTVKLFHGHIPNTVVPLSHWVKLIDFGHEVNLN